MPSSLATHFDDSRWVSSKYYCSGTLNTPDEVTLHYIDCSPPPGVDYKGTILLIHGFPETSYQFRHVITPISDFGYRVIAPDYRGAGYSSHPRDGFTKTQLAEDIYKLVTQHLSIKKVHVVGHDIGGMVAHAFATRHQDATASVIWGECPMPGTDTYEEIKKEPRVWHFTFHWQGDLPEALVAGRERIYLKHFYDRLTSNPGRGISIADLDFYTTMFSQPGGMRCGFEVYRAFHKDAEENRSWLQNHGRCMVPCMNLCGDGTFHAKTAESQVNQMYENAERKVVEKSGHFIAEENPEDFIKKVLGFIEKRSS